MIWQAVTYMISDSQLEYTISKVSPPSGENENKVKMVPKSFDGAKIIVSLAQSKTCKQIRRKNAWASISNTLDIKYKYILLLFFLWLHAIT